MDVNGTRFQLLKGRSDWELCTANGGPPFVTGTQLGWDSDRDALSLCPVLTLFKHKEAPPLDPSSRHGAARAVGSSFWIADDNIRIFWIPAGDEAPSIFWSQEATDSVGPDDAFTPLTPAVPEIYRLAGMAITSHHYLVVGYTGSDHGVFVFDLSSGGPPLRLVFPSDAPFTPFDMSADDQANVWILDRINATIWGLDREFRLIGLPSGKSAPTRPPTFAPTTPMDNGAVVSQPNTPTPLLGFPVQPGNPVAIEALQDGSVLILHNPVGSTCSFVSRYRLGEKLIEPVPIQADIEVVYDGSTDVTLPPLDLIGYDFALLPSDTPKSGTLYLLEQAGDQVIAFHVSFALPSAAISLHATVTYLPLIYFAGRGLVKQSGTLYYDVAVGADHDQSTRWVELQAIDQPRYDTFAKLQTPVFDGKAQDCVWHRLFLDACLPPETEVVVESRAANSREILVNMPWVREPNLYRRSAGTEIAYYNPFGSDDAPEKGTYETLFQHAEGQYIQLQLSLSGNGRVSPFLYCLRAYYPRFSYPRRYLPAVYLEDAESLSFLERLLANPEGFITDIDGKIENVSALFDGRSAPPEALDWLAGWMGLLLDPLWETIQQRRQEAFGGSRTGSYANPPPDRRRLIIRFARLLYERRGTLEGIRFSLHLLLDPCLEVILQQLKALAVVQGDRCPNSPEVLQTPGLAALMRDMQLIGAPYPTPGTGETEMEDLLYQIVISPDRISPIRIVEKYRTRAGRAVVSGDPTQASSGSDGMAADMALRSQSAHRFSVLIPQGILPEESAMVRRIVQLEKPAHTVFDIRLYWEGFRVGEARLGLETMLGESARYTPTILKISALSESYLTARPPMDATDRVISDRDSLGDLPPL